MLVMYRYPSLSFSFSILFLIVLFPMSVVAERFILNGSLHTNCHDDGEPPVGEVCAQSPTVSSDWKLSLKLERADGTDILLDRDPPINHSIMNLTDENFPSPGSGRTIVVEVTRRPESDGDDCFFLGDVWLHSLGDKGEGACRYLLHRRVQENICNPNGVARFASQLPVLPENCSELGLEGSVREFAEATLRGVEVGQKITFNLDLKSALTGQPVAYGVSGCFPDTIAFYDWSQDNFPLVARALPESHQPPGVTPLAECESGLSYENGSRGVSTLRYEAVPRQTGVGRFLNESPIAARFRAGGITFGPVADRLVDNAIRVTGGLSLLADAPTLVTPEQNRFTTSLTITNEGQGTATVTGRDCSEFVTSAGLPNIEVQGTSGFEEDFTIPGGGSVQVNCTYAIRGTGNVDFDFRTFWIHESGGEVLTRFECEKQPSGRTRCLDSSLVNGEFDLVRVSISERDGECGDGIIDGDEDCDGGACCTDECTFVERGEPCRGQSACATGDGLCFGDRPFCPGETEQDGISTVDFEFDSPAGESPTIFTNGWMLGIKATARCNNGNDRDVSSFVEWSGTGTFSPSTGSRTRPTFSSAGSQTVTVAFEDFSENRTFQTISSAGYAAIGDEAFVPADSHGAPSDPAQARGPIMSGSGVVTINGVPAAAVGSRGLHASCAGANAFIVSEGDGSVLIHGAPAARLGDRTTHCGGIGSIVDVASSRALLALSRSQLQAQSGDAVISGTVTSTDGTPLERIPVIATDETGAVFPNWTDEQGRYRIEDLAAGNYSVRCSGEVSGFIALQLSGSVTLSATTVSENNNCVLEQGASISGSVEDTAGQGLGSVWVHASRVDDEADTRSAVTNSNGAYVISGLTEGQYRILASGETRNLISRYFPSAESWDRARAVPARSGEETSDIIITLGTADPADFCQTESSFEDRTELSRFIDLQVASNTRVFKLFNRARRRAGKRLKKLRARLRAITTESSQQARDASGALPGIYYTACQENVGCISRSTNDLRESYTNSIRALFANVRRIARRTQALSRSSNVALRRARSTARRRLRNALRQIESIPENVTECS